MDTFKFTKIAIGLMGIWMIVSGIPDIIMWLYNLDIALESDPLEKYFMSFAQIPLAHFMMNIVLGVTLIAFRKHIAKLLGLSSNDHINVTSKDIKNIALIAFPAWIIIHALVMLTFFGGDALGDILRGVIGIALLSVSYFYLLKRCNK